MAIVWVTASLRSRYFSLCLAAILLGCFHNVSCYVPSILKVTCRDTMDLRGLNLKSGIIVSDLPARIPIYPNPDQYCDIFISFSEGTEMMFYFESLDLYSSSGGSRCDSTNIELFDGSTNARVRGLDGPICGRLEEMPTQVYYVLNRLLVIRANSMGDVQGNGFSIHFTVYRKGFPCSRDEFNCEDMDAHSGSAQQGYKRCVDTQLVCDEYNDCGDWADERQNCNDLTTGAIAAIVIVALGLVGLVVGLIIFCKIRREREIRRLTEKGDEASAAVMRGLLNKDTSFASSRGGGGMMPPFTVSNEMDKERYVPRYNAGRNSIRSRAQGAPGNEEHPPPYTEKVPLDAGSEHGSDYDEKPRSRAGSRRRDLEPDEVFKDEEEEAPRTRRGRSRSQEREPRFDRYPPRDDRQLPRRDDQDSPPIRRGDRERERPRSRYDDDRDRDRPSSRHDQRDRDQERERMPSRYDDREGDPRPRSRYGDDDERDRDRDRPTSRYDDRGREREPRGREGERPMSRRGYPVAEVEDDKRDQLHPLREHKRRSMHTDSDHDASGEERPPPPQDRSPQEKEDRRRATAPPPDDYDERNPRPPRDERDPRRPDNSRLRPQRDPRDERSSSPRGSDRDDRPPPRDRERDERPPRDRNASRGSPQDDRRPRSSQDRPPERNSRQPPSRATADDSYEDVAFPPPPPPLAAQEEDFDDAPPPNRNQRRHRSRSREDKERGGRGRGGGGGGEPARAAHGGYREESV